MSQTWRTKPTVVMLPVVVHAFVRAYSFELAPCGASWYVRPFGMSQKLREALQAAYGCHLYRNTDLEGDFLRFFQYPYGPAMFHRLSKKVGVPSDDAQYEAKNAGGVDANGCGLADLKDANAKNKVCMSLVV